MHIMVFGAGGVGGYFGGRLAHAGEKVTFIARGSHLKAILANGLSVESIKGDFTIHPVDATDYPDSVRDVDTVLMCVKAWQIPECASTLLPAIGSATMVVPLENGVEAPAQLSGILGRKHVLGGLCGILSHISSPGHIQHTGSEPFIEFGELDNRPSKRTHDLLHVFEHAGIRASIPPDINAALWIKFMFVSAVSGIGAVTRVPAGIFRSQPGTRRMLEGAIKECYSVALAQGIPLPPESLNNTLARIDSLPPDAIASMHRDILDGKPSELEAQNGAVVRLGKQYNVPTPIHEFLYQSLLPQESIARKENT